MKKISVALIAVLMSVAMLFCVACDKPEENKGAKNATLVISNGTEVVKVVTDDTDCANVADWMIEMNGESKITLTYTDSQYGMNISTLEGISVGGMTFFAFYADDEENTNDAWGSYSYNNKTYYSCAFGQSSMPLKDGCTYLLVYTVYQA